MRSLMEARAVRRAGARVAIGAAVLMVGSLMVSASCPGSSPPAADAAQPAAPAAPAKPQLTFDNADAVVWFYAVKGDSGAKFEEFFGRVKEAMAKSTNPERKTQAAGMRLMKSTSPAGDGTINYVLIISPISKGQEYSPGMLLFEVFPTEAKTLVGRAPVVHQRQGAERGRAAHQRDDARRHVGPGQPPAHGPRRCSRSDRGLRPYAQHPAYALPGVHGRGPSSRGPGPGGPAASGRASRPGSPGDPSCPPCPRHCRWPGRPGWSCTRSRRTRRPISRP